MSRYATGEPDYYSGKWEHAANMLLEAYQPPDDDYELIETEFCVCCGREIYPNEKCTDCGQCIRFVGGCCTCKTAIFNLED